MISVLNRLRLLNGNSPVFLFSFFLLIISCGSLNVTKRSGTVLNPVEQTHVEESPKNGGVVITTDNNKYLKKKKTTTVTFMGQQFKSVLSDVDEYRIAIILPFCFNKDGRISEQLRSVSMEYFEGIELALKELDKSGYKIHAEVFDSQNDTLAISRLLKQDYLKNVHLVIGPIYDHEIKLVETHCGIYQIPFVSPLRFYKKHSRTSSPIYNPVSEDSTRHYLAALELIKLYGTSKFYLLNDNKPEAFPARRAIVRAFSEAKKNIHTITLGEIKVQIESGVDMVILAPIKSDVTVHHLLNSTTGKSNVKVVGLEDWFDFPIIPFATWEKCNLLFYSNYHVDQLDSSIIQFNEKYRFEYGGIPGKFSYIGYDQAMFFVQALAVFGTDFGNYLNEHTFPLVHTSFRFVRMDNDTYDNRFINILKLNEGFDLEKIN
ncbi:MAG: amino acid ABC transporter substrate-binding protein [Bacteroidetes bacterium]|nr:amino acid ABC transporter substrate-binding protein [Bacteroidota bacterium]